MVLLNRDHSASEGQQASPGKHLQVAGAGVAATWLMPAAKSHEAARKDRILYRRVNRTLRVRKNYERNGCACRLRKQEKKDGGFERV